LIIYLPEIVLSPEKVIQKTAMYQSVSYVSVLFGIGVVFFLILFLVKFFKIISLIRKNEIVKKPFYKLVLLPKDTKAFSFFNFIFLGKEIPESQQAQIIAHELVHSNQKHSLDLLLFEFLKIMMWFNPMIYFYQNRITLIHEYISDEVAAKSATKEMYINNLLSNFFQVENIAFVNQFYKKTLIKKRIIMMKKTQSKKKNQLKYLVLIPVLVSMLFYVSCTNSNSDSKEEYQGKIKIKDEFYLIKQNELGETIGINSEGKKVDVLSLLPESVVALNFENGKLVTEFNYSSKSEANKNKTQVITGTQVLEKKTSDNRDVSFTVIDKAPTFPGCESGDRACFSKEVQKHFSREFNADLPNQLGLKAGRKRVFIGFKIDEEGNVVDVNARAPHQDIKEEVIRVMNMLPKVTPGEQDGKAVGVKYSIPFTIVIE